MAGRDAGVEWDVAPLGGIEFAGESGGAHQPAEDQDRYPTHRSAPIARAILWDHVGAAPQGQDVAFALNVNRAHGHS